jgi:cytolysin-activating lysine-acyltransferase
MDLRPTDIAADEVAPAPSEMSVTNIRNNAAIVGDIAWLMMESAWHRARQVADFSRLVMPPTKHRQFRLFHEGNVPIAFISWALLSPEAERRYLDDPYCLAPEDWASGNAIYLVDFVASRNAIRKIAPYLRRDPLISVAPVRGVRIRNDTRTIIEIFEDQRGRHVKATRLV